MVESEDNGKTMHYQRYILIVSKQERRSETGSRKRKGLLAQGRPPKCDFSFVMHEGVCKRKHLCVQRSL